MSGKVVLKAGQARQGGRKTAFCCSKRGKAKQAKHITTLGWSGAVWLDQMQVLLNSRMNKKQDE